MQQSKYIYFRYITIIIAYPYRKICYIAYHFTPSLFQKYISSSTKFPYLTYHIAGNARVQYFTFIFNGSN